MTTVPDSQGNTIISLLCGTQKTTVSISKGDRGDKGDVGISSTAANYLTILQRFLKLDSAQKHATFTGINVHIQNGTDYTNKINGFGNLIVGYNGTRKRQTLQRTGSHNIVIGDAHEYLSYGGFVAGFSNTLEKGYSSVSGGYGNTANGNYSSVSGGNTNTAGGDFSSVSGGYKNTASGSNSSVSGGAGNAAKGPYSSVVGGKSQTAYTTYEHKP
jgi:hypothetical protein